MIWSGLFQKPSKSFQNDDWCRFWWIKANSTVFFFAWLRQSQAAETRIRRPSRLGLSTCVPTRAKRQKRVVKNSPVLRYVLTDKQNLEWTSRYPFCGFSTELLKISCPGYLRWRDSQRYVHKLTLGMWPIPLRALVWPGLEVEKQEPQHWVSLRKTWVFDSHLEANFWQK